MSFFIGVVFAASVLIGSASKMIGADDVPMFNAPTRHVSDGLVYDFTAGPPLVQYPGMGG